MPDRTPRILSIEEAVALDEAADPHVSPDGRRVAFVVRACSRDGEHARSAIYVAPVDAAVPAHRWTAGLAEDRTPRWSPDGRRLAFMSDRSTRGRPALYVMPSGGGEATRLGSLRGKASDPRWSPDGRYIAVLLSEIDGAAEEARKKARDDAAAADDDKLTRLWIVAAATGAAWPATPPDLNIWMHAWSPSGDRIAVVHSPSPRVNDAYRRYTLATVAVDERGAPADPAQPLRLCGLYGDTIGALCWSPDSTRLALVGPRVQQPDVLAADVPLIVPAGGGPPVPAVAECDTQFTWVDWLADDELVAAGDEDTYSVLYRIRLDGAMKPFFAAGPRIAGTPRQLALGGDRATLAVTREDITSPGDLWTAHAGGHAPRRLTTLNPRLATLAWGHSRPVAWAAPDGLEIHGLLVTPVGYVAGRRYPAVVHVHGGPAWLWADRFYASWHDWAQLLAARGYVVLLPNPRGSTGRGTAYLRGNYADFGGGEWQDVLAGAHWLVAQGLADGARLGLGGWSWGGYLTAWGVTQTALFKAAVMGAGCSNLVSDHGQNNCPDMNRLYFDNLPYAVAAPYWARSPLAHVTRVRTPTLILHGECDEIVNPAQAREFYRALVTLGVPTRLVLYPREPHGLEERAHHLDLLRRVLDWFDTYVKQEISVP